MVRNDALKLVPTRTVLIAIYRLLWYLYGKVVLCYTVERTTLNIRRLNSLSDNLIKVITATKHAALEYRQLCREYNTL